MKGVAIITGASSGLGEALARELHGRGWKVGLIARREEQLRALADSLGDGAAHATADVASVEDVEEAVAQLQQSLGPCTLMIANAGIGTYTTCRNWETAAVTRVLQVNTLGVIHTIGAVIPQMVERGSGHVAVVSSVAGYRGLPGFGAYSASKAAVSNLFESLRGELIPMGIAVTSIHPGYVETPLTDSNKFKMPFLIPATKAARIMANGLEKRKKEINYPWQMACLMGMARHLPNWAWDMAVSGANPASKSKSRADLESS
jgi:short-subunit dehydrogenase